MKTGPYLLLAAVVLSSACGKQAHMEAARLAKALTEKQADFANANTIEKDFVTNARAWCGGIVAGGAGRGVELEQNASVATQLAKSLAAASASLGQVRQAVSDQEPKEEYPQGVRNTLITQLTRRQRELQNMRTLLEQAAEQFSEYRNSKAYAGDTYPGGIAKLDALLKAYKEPEDVVGTALADLKSKYSLRPGEF